MRNIIKLVSIFCILTFNSLYAQITVKATVDHDDPFYPFGIDTLGNISLAISGGTSPYTYKWSPGNSTIKDKTAAVKDSYTVRVKDNSGDSAFYYYNLGYKTNWINCYGTKLRRDSLMETGSISGNVTAITKNTLLENTDGWLEFVVPDFTYPYLMGFLDSSSIASQSVHDDVDFAFHLTWGNTLYAWSNGYFTWLGSANAGDVMRVERIGSTYYLKKNNITIHSASTLSYRRLKVKALLDTQPLANIGVSFKDTNSIIKLQNVLATIDHIKPDGIDSLGNIYLSMVGGDPAFTYTWTPDSTHLRDQTFARRNSYSVKIKDQNGDSIIKSYRLGYKVEWTDLYGSGTTFVQDTLHADAASSSTGLSSAASVNELRPNIDGWAQYIVQDFGSPYVVGFSDSIIASDHGTINDINCAFHVSYGSNLYSWYSGYWSWLGTVTSGDIITLLRGGSSYYIKKNNDTVFTGSANATRNLRLKCTINDNYYLANIGVSFSDSTSSRPLIAKAYIDHISLSGGDTLGNIKPNISGGVMPYTFKWLPGNSTASEKLETRKDSYTLKVKDFHGDSVMYYYNLGYKTDWTNFYGSGTHFKNDTLFADHASTPSGNSSALSKNELRPFTNGWIQMVLPEFSSPYVFGLLDSASSASIGSHDDFDFAFHETYGSNMYAWNGSYFTWLGVGKAGDVIKIERTSSAFGSTFYIKRNNATIYNSSAIANKRLKIKATINDDFYLSNIGASFTPSLTVDYNKSDVQSEDEPNSAFIYLTPKNGIPPYHYLWSNSSTGNALSDIGVGTYSVIVTDSLRDTVRIAFTIGKEIKFKKLNNISLSNGNFIKNDYQKPSVANTSHYIPSGSDGYYELMISDTLTNFNFLFRTIDTTNDEQPQPITIVKTRTVHLAWSSLPSRGTSDYNLINFTDTVTTRDSAWVIKKEFYTDTCKFLSSCSSLTLSGIHYDYGKLYVLTNGSTIRKGTVMNDNTAIRLSLESNYLKVSQNGILIESNSLTHSNPVIGDLILNSPGLGLRTFNGSTNLLDLQPYLCRNCGNDNARNWFQSTSYDNYGNIIAESRQYFDYMGRNTQSQVRNISENNILATQILYDVYGRQVLTSLPAPINQACFCFKTGFIKNNSNTDYTYNDFDVPNFTNNSSYPVLGEVDAPQYVNNSTSGTLGWYYSNNNTLEKYVPICKTSYARIKYSKIDPSSIVCSSSPGDALMSGSSHESYNIKMDSEGELATVFGAGYGWRVDQINNFYSTDPCETYMIKAVPLMNTAAMSLKSIDIDANGVETVTYADLAGNEIASCLAGKINGSNVKTQTVKTWLSWTDETKRYADIHLPDGCQTSFAIQYPGGTPSSAPYPTYNIINLKTGEYVYSSGTNPVFTGNNSGPSLSPGYYRIVLKSMPTGMSGLNVIHDLNYYNFTLNYYDYANRLKSVVSPKGFDDTYTYGVPQGSQTERLNMYNINSSSNVPANFPVGTTWSLDSTSFSSTKTLSLTQVPHSGKNNVQLKLTFGGRKIDGIGPLNGGSGSSDIRSTYSTTAWNNYTDENFIVDTSVVENDLDSANCPSRDIYFRVRIALLDSRDTIISGSIQESYNLKCRVKACASNYYSWSPAEFTYQNTFDNSINRDSIPNWKKIKILNLEPVFHTYGDTFLTYSSIVNRIMVTANISELIGGPSKPNHKIADRYRYNSWGELLNTVNMDAGQTDFVYTKDGKSKFVQNAKQDASNTNTVLRKYTYTDFDNYDRPVSSAEYNPATSTFFMNVFFENYQEHDANPSPPSGQYSVHNLLFSDCTPMFASAISDALTIKYDSYDPNFWSETGFSSIDYIQHHLAGNISYSYNDQKKTWYSYDEQGRVEWMVQKYYNVGTTGTSNQHVVKTFNYKYDYQGNVTEVDYNKENSADRFFHYYEYDLDQRLKRAYTSRNGFAKKIQAKYEFYLHGPLKRIELADKIQALDFVYTINGWLKSINGPEMDQDHDPGKDGYLNNVAENSVYKDIFGTALEYYHDDYIRAGTNIQSYDDSQNGTPYAPDLYNGILKGQRWQTKTPSGYTGLSYPNQHLMFGYKYDKKYQLLEAGFATITSNGNQNQATTPGSPIAMASSLQTDYKTNNITYDYNGNILTLTRKAWAASSSGVNLDDLTYSYQSCNNKLSKVVDAVSTNPYTTLGFDPGQGNNNYAYNAIGEQTLNTNDGKKYEYNNFGNITAIRDLSNNLIATYEYDELGYRVKKTAYLSTSIKNTLYIRDASGKIITTFEKTGANTTTDYSIPSEWNVYAGNRVGILDNTGGTETYIYELSDNQGNVRATFKRQNKTSMTTNFNGGGADDNWFSSANLVNNASFGTSGAFSSTGSSVKTGGYTVPTSGACTKLIPVKYNDNLTLEWYSYKSGAAVNTGMAVEICDASGNPLPGGSQFYQVPAGLNWFVNNYVTYVVSLNYPEMYLKLTAQNNSPNQVVYFDNISVTFNTGGVNAPEQLNMATYYPHGSVMPGMNYNTSYKYKYGYQGQFAEKDDESNENFFDLRNYNPLLGRFSTTDPYNQHFSSYLAMDNSNPNSVDPDGGWSAVGACVGAGIGFGIGVAYSVNQKTAGYEVPIFMAAGALIGGFSDVIHFSTPKITAAASQEIMIIVKRDPWDPKNNDLGKMDGHVFLVVDGKNYGFVPGRTRNGRRLENKDGYEINRFLKSDGAIDDKPDYLNHSLETRKHVIYKMKITEKQKSKLLSNINSSKKNLPYYGLLHTRCASWALRMLLRSDVIGSSSIFFRWSPTPAGKYIGRQPGVSKYKFNELSE